MEKSTVYFTDFRCPVGTSQLDKLKKLCDRICPAVTEDGVARELKTLGLI